MNDLFEIGLIIAPVMVLTAINLMNWQEVREQRARNKRLQNMLDESLAQTDKMIETCNGLTETLNNSNKEMEYLLSFQLPKVS